MIRRGYRAARRHEGEPCLGVGEDIDGVLDRDGADALEATPVSSPKHAGKGSRARPAAAGQPEVSSTEGLELQNYRLGPHLAILFVHQPAGCPR